MFKLKCIFLLVVFCLSVSNVYAEYKVAIVDLNRVVNSTTEAKIKREELEKLSNAAIYIYYLQKIHQTIF